jgi:NADH-quinone oxidoreductase subunit E
MSVLTDQMRAAIREELAKYPDKQAATLPALHITQDALRHVPLEAIREIAEMLDLHPAQVHDTMSFYGFFRDEKQPLGKHRVWVCRSLSCMLCGSETLLVELCRRLGVQPGGTTADGKFTLEPAECLGVCEGGPCMLVDDECYGNLTAERAEQIPEQLP